jgi:hypothetical protein
LIERSATQITSGDRDHPGVGGDDGAADCALISGRGHDDDAPPRGMIERLHQGKLRSER